MGNRRKDLFNQLDGLLGDAIDLDFGKDSKSSTPKYESSKITSSKKSNASTNSSSIQNRIAMFENNDYGSGKFARRPSTSSSTSINRSIRTSPIQKIELTQPSASTLMKTRSRITPQNSRTDKATSTHESSNRRAVAAIDDFIDSFNSSSNSDTDFDEESTHTADTSIFSDSPPPKSASAKSPTTSTLTHQQFQNKIRIGTSTVDHLSGMLECMEAMVLAENDFILEELIKFTSTIQESAAHNTYAIKVFR